MIHDGQQIRQSDGGSTGGRGVSDPPVRNLLLAILEEAKAAHAASKENHAELRRINGTVARLSQHVEGTEADRESGLLHRVHDLDERTDTLEGARDESAAVLRVGRWVIAAMFAALTVLVGMAGLLLRVIGVI